MQELPFLHSARRLMLIDTCMKFREDSFRGFQVTERTRFVTVRQTDRRTDDGRPGKNNMSPNPSGGDIIIAKCKSCKMAVSTKSDRQKLHRQKCLESQIKYDFLHKFN